MKQLDLFNSLIEKPIEEFYLNLLGEPLPWEQEEYQEFLEKKDLKIGNIL